MSKEMFKGLLAVLLVSALPGAVRAEDQSPWAVDTAAGFYSDYMWRGFQLFDGTSVQPSLNVAYTAPCGTTSANLWMHISAESDTAATSKFTELDGTLSHAMNFAPFTLKVGHIWYAYPDTEDDIKDTNEFFGTLVLDDSEYNSILSLTPSLTVYQDYDEYDSQYYELGLSHGFQMDATGNNLLLTPFAVVGFASNAEKVYADDGLVQATYGVAVSTTVMNLTLSPSVNFTHEFDDLLQNEFWFGASLSKRF